MESKLFEIQPGPIVLLETERRFQARGLLIWRILWKLHRAGRLRISFRDALTFAKEHGMPGFLTDLACNNRAAPEAYLNALVRKETDARTRKVLAPYYLTADLVKSGIVKPGAMDLWQARPVTLEQCASLGRGYVSRDNTDWQLAGQPTLQWTRKSMQQWPWKPTREPTRQPTPQPTPQPTRQPTQQRTQAGASQPSKRFRLPGRSCLEKVFNDHVVDVVENPRCYKSLGIGFPGATVLHGPPGCGKTYAVEQLGKHLGWPRFYIDSQSIGSTFIHGTSKKIGKIFEKAADSSPSIIIIDEMEAYLSERQARSHRHEVEEVAEFLRRIPEACKNKILLIGMTNKIEMIDPAVLRHGRFDRVLEVEMPDAKEVSELLANLMRDLPTDGRINVDAAVEILTGKALSSVAFVVREAARLAARARRSRISQQFFDAALASLPGNDSSKGRIGFI